LFATHYFELTRLADSVAGVANIHLDAAEYGERLVFLHTVKEGPANRSYGLQVAALAGVPASVVAAARTYLTELERTPQPAPATSVVEARPQMSLFEAAPSPALKLLDSLNPDELAPRDALDWLYRLKRER
jgi:DNA mismatch repair protein MutS